MPEMMVLLAVLCFVAAAAMLLNRSQAVKRVGAVESVTIGQYVTGLEYAGATINVTCAITPAELVFINDRGTEMGRVAIRDLSRVEVAPGADGKHANLVFHRRDAHHPAGNIVFRGSTADQVNRAGVQIRPFLQRPAAAEDPAAAPVRATAGARPCTGCGAAVASSAGRCEYCNRPAA